MSKTASFPNTANLELSSLAYQIIRLQQRQYFPKMTEYSIGYQLKYTEKLCSFNITAFLVMQQ